MLWTHSTKIFWLKQPRIFRIQDPFVSTGPMDVVPSSCPSACKRARSMPVVATPDFSWKTFSHSECLKQPDWNQLTPKIVKPSNSAGFATKDRHWEDPTSKYLFWTTLSLSLLKTSCFVDLIVNHFVGLTGSLQTASATGRYYHVYVDSVDFFPTFFPTIWWSLSKQI